MTSRTGRRSNRPQPISGGFTLLEMLVVLGVIMLLMGITLGGIFRLMHTNPILAAEQLVAGVVRQGRHTARSSGAPVVIEIRRDTVSGQVIGGIVSGVSREPLWTEPFEGGAANALGVSGGGRFIDGASNPPPAALDLTIDESGTPTKSRRLVRGTAGQNGFYLACAVRPPNAGEPGPGPTGPTLIPLLMIGDNSANSDSTKSLGGLLLRKKNIPQQQASSQTAWLKCWEIVGWIEGDPTLATLDPATTAVSSTELLDKPADVDRDEPSLHTTVPAANLDIADPIGGDRWEEIGLLYDRQHLVLYRNGQRVGEKVVAPGGSDHDLPPDKDQMVIGAGDFDGAPVVAAQTTIDDARLYRLNIDQLGRLPKGVVPLDDYRITIHPDGRVEPRSASGALLANNQLILQDRFDPKKKATIEVFIDGRISSRIEVAP